MTYLLEQWKPIVGFESLYLVSNTGRVWSIRSGKEKKVWLDEWGYPSVSLSQQGKQSPKKVHGLIAAVFHGPRPEGMTVNHKDGWKRNSRASNLEYLTDRDNIHHAIANGLRSPGRKPGAGYKLTREQVLEIKRLKGTGTAGEIAKQFGVVANTVTRIYNGRIWKSVP